MNSNIQIHSSAPKPLFRLSRFSFEALPSFFNKCVEKLTPPQKVIVVSVGAGIVLVGLVARYFRRRKRIRKSALANPKEHFKFRKNKPIMFRSPSGEFHSIGGNTSPGFHRSNYRHSSISIGSDKISIASAITGTGTSQHGEAGELTPQQYGVMGMESLEGAIGLWEEALASYAAERSTHGKALPTQETAEFTQSLQKVIEDAYLLQDQCEHLFLHEHSVLFKSADVTPDLSEAGYGDRRTITSMFSSMESFVSAQGDIADLRNLEEFEENPPTLYLTALKHHEENGIPFRDVRTERVRCGTDVEYICKVHCLRLASHLIFSQPSNKEWFAEAGRNVIHGLLLRSDKDPKECLCAYDDFLVYLTDCNWKEVDSELKARGVPAITFYDVVLDFILIDSFEDLENPPTSVYAVVQNRWLSNGFKESALATAVWSVLKAKRRMLKDQDGFIAHFYDVTEHLSPVLAWGFLGPDHRFREICQFFKDQVTGMLQDMFSFSTVRYTSVEDLSEDILIVAKERYEVLMERLSQPQPNGSIQSNN